MAWAELSDVRCYYESLGEGDPVLLVQGLGNTCRSWDELTPELAAQFSVIVMDHFGIGRSESRRTPRTLADYAVSFVELLDELQLDRVHVVGISLGGIMAQRLAMDHPQRVDRLVLISCTHHFGPYLTEMATLLGKAARYFPYKTFLRTMELLGTGPCYLDEHPWRVNEQVQAKSECHVSRLAVAHQLRALSASDPAPADFKILSPTLVIGGEFDPLIPSVYAKKMAHDIPDSRLMIIPGCGHNPVTERPDVVVPAIIDFLGEESVSRKHRSFMDELSSHLRHPFPARELRPHTATQVSHDWSH